MIVKYDKEAKKGLSIQNTFRHLLKDGHKVTIRQIEKAIKQKDEYHKAKNSPEEKDLFLKTVASIHDYQADTFSIKQHSKSYVKFVALINIETRLGYVYHVPDIKKKTVVEAFNRWVEEVPKDQYPVSISSDLGNELNNKDFYE